jgi:hypothetical protein
MKTRILLLASTALLAAGCTSPRERMEQLSVEINPLRKARIGDVCRYRAVRTGDGGEGVAETWTLRVSGSSRGQARVDVAVLGAARTPPSPSPREPGYSLKLPTADAGIAATEVLRLFHRPALTTEGMLAVVGREEPKIEGTTRSFTTVVFDRTRDARELLVTIQDPSLVRGTYRIVVVDEIAVLGIVEAELDEVWTVLDPDGTIRTEKRHDKLELVEARGAADAK